MKTNDINTWERYVMNQRTNELISMLDYKNFDVFEISGARWFPSASQFKSYENTNNKESFDICFPPAELKLNEYDLIIAEQVLEHVVDPERAIKTILSMLRIGGYFLLSVPVIFMYHPGPNDYWRWTQEGMVELLKKVGCTSMTVESWGNYECVVTNLKNWVIYDQTRHSLANEVEYPIICWALVRKVI